MPEETRAPPGSFGVEGLTRAVNALHEHLDGTLAQMRQELRAGFHRLERMEKKLMAQIDDLNTVLTAVADAETKLGVDLGTVIDFLKANPSPTDLTSQIATLTQVRDNLMNSDAKTLANLPPVPDPNPPAGRR